MSTLNTHQASYDGPNRPAHCNEHIQDHWAHVLRNNYRRLRSAGVDAGTARTVVHAAYLVGVDAAREEAHKRYMEGVS